MKKLINFSIYLLFAIVAISCNTESLNTSTFVDKDATLRSSGLALQVTLKNKSTATYYATNFIIGDEVDGFRVTLNPGTFGSQVLTNAESVLINGGTFNITKSDGTVYTQKTYLHTTDASLGFNTTLNPGAINFNASSIIGEDADGL